MLMFPCFGMIIWHCLLLHQTSLKSHIVSKTHIHPVLEIQKELWYAVIRPDYVLQILSSPNPPFLLETDLLHELLNYDTRRRMLEFETFNYNHFGKSENINFITDEIFNLSASKNRELYKEIIYLPFENMSIPAPKEYEKILSIQYGD